MKKKLRYIDHRLKVVLFVILIIILLLLMFMIFSTMVQINEAQVYSVQESSDIDYKVYLKENDFYEESYLTEDMSYIASLIDSIEITFDYQLLTDATSNFTYKYYVEGDLEISSSGTSGEVIYKKNYTLYESEAETINNASRVAFDEVIDIDYDEYNQIAKDFKSVYSISANNNFIISIYVEVYDNQDIINTSNVMTITMPLTEQMVEIELSYEEISSNENIFKDFSVSYTFSFIKIFMLLCMFIAIMFLMYLIIKVIADNKKIINEYNQYIKKTMNKYDQIIVSVENLIDFKGYDVIDISNFKELLDLYETSSEPIMYCELIKNKFGVFVLIHNDIVYKLDTSQIIYTGGIK